MLPEPVSPELVLIDPELARRERAKLEERAYLNEVLDVSALRRAVETQLLPMEEKAARIPPWQHAARFSKRRLLPALLLCSLLVNGLFVARLVGNQGQEAAQVAVRMVTLTVSTQTSTLETQRPPAASRANANGQRQATPPRTKAEVERTIVSLILAAPARKLPASFIDSTTGLVKNNVQVVCTNTTHRSFLCGVRVPSADKGRTLFVRYVVKKNHRGFFQWFGYRRGSLQ